MDKVNFDKFVNWAIGAARNEVPSNHHAEIAKAIALGNIAESLEKIASCVQIGKDGKPCLQVTDTYQEWKGNL